MKDKDQRRRHIGGFDRKVYVSQFNPNLNYSAAEEYGEVIFLTNKEFKAHPTIDELNECVLVEMKTNLKGYKSGLDYILLTGSPMASVLVGSLVGGMTGTHNLLKWNNITKKYELVKFSANKNTQQLRAHYEHRDTRV